MNANPQLRKVNARTAPVGAMGQKHLACGERMSMRLWSEEGPIGTKAPTVRDYETIGFVIHGRAELDIEGERIVLEPGDSYVVPHGARHSYTITESFSAVEVTSPPAQMQGRDAQPPAS